MKDETNNYLFHVRRDSDGDALPGLALARISSADKKIDVAFIGPYPQAMEQEAIEWLGARTDGFAACSDFEWWDLTEVDAPSEYEDLMGKPWPLFYKFVENFWREHDAKGVPL